MTYKLSHLLGLLEEVISTAFKGESFWVVAETLDIKNYPDRSYCFATLVEKSDKTIVAKADAVIWRSNYQIIRNFEKQTGTAFEKNMQLLLRVTVEYSAQWGLRLQIHEIDASFTLGKLEQERQLILNRLITEHADAIQLVDGNYFTTNKNLELPVVIQNIALITAPNSDGLNDFKHELAANQFGYKFHITEFLTQIQGAGAEVAILKQLEIIQNSNAHFDAVIITRGGGSQLDFGAFNTYELGFAVATFPIPVIAGIGHERNVSIVDLMCWQSVKTPTKAASFIISFNREFEETLLLQKENLLTGIENYFDGEKEKLAEATETLKDAAANYLDNLKHDLEILSLTVKHLNPQNVLARGYAIVKKQNRVVTNALMLADNDTIETTFKNFTVTSTVNLINEIEL